MKLFEYMRSNEQYCKLFSQAMSESSSMVMEIVLEAYDGFKDVKTLVDVGGGLGNTLSLITSKYPHILGINFDLPPVIARAPLYPGRNHAFILKFNKQLSKLKFQYTFFKTNNFTIMFLFLFCVYCSNL